MLFRLIAFQLFEKKLVERRRCVVRTQPGARRLALGLVWRPAHRGRSFGGQGPERRDDDEEPDVETGTATRSTTVSAARETLRPSSSPPPPPSSNTPAITTAAGAAAAATTSSTTSVRCAALVYTSSHPGFVLLPFVSQYIG